MARRRSVRKHHSRKHKGGSRRVKRTRRHHKRQKGGNAGCGAPAAGGAACNAGSAGNYAVTMVGDAFIQMKQALASAFS